VIEGASRGDVRPPPRDIEYMGGVSVFRNGDEAPDKEKYA